MAVDPLATALDRFDVPPMTPGLADRIVAAAVASDGLPPRAPPRHDRSRWWKRGRQFAIAGVAAGMLSAAAVASGLLGAAGIHVPVLAAMLMPKPVVKPAPKPHHHAPAVRQAAVVAPKSPAPAAFPAPEPVALDRAAMIEARQQRRAAFAADHPRIAAAVERRIIARVAERRAAKGLPPPRLDADGRPVNPKVRAMIERRTANLVWRRAMLRRAALAQGEGDTLVRAQRLRRWQQWRALRDPGPAGPLEVTDNGAVQQP